MTEPHITCAPSTEVFTIQGSDRITVKFLSNLLLRMELSMDDISKISSMFQYFTRL